MTFKEYIAQIKQPRAQAVLAACIPLSIVVLLLESKFPGSFISNKKNPLTMFSTIILGWTWIAVYYFPLKVTYHFIRLDIRNCAFSGGLSLSAVFCAAFIVKIFS